MAITSEGTSQSFSYTGGVQTFTVPYEGLYKLEVWGAKGGNANGCAGGSGGYAIGYAVLKKNTTLYVVCGGQGTEVKAGAATGGYNGGGNANCSLNHTDYAGSGGGATHIAKVNGTLASIGITSFVTNKNGLIIAGGGGGSYYSPETPVKGSRAGGSGGGTSGGNGDPYQGLTVLAVAGGTQTSGYAFGTGETKVATANNAATTNSGGGGGLYGGLADYYCGSGGGSGWTDGVPTITFKDATYSPSMSNGVNSGNGKATITFVKKGFPTVHFDGTLLEGITFDGIEIDTIIFNGTTII